MFNIINKPNYSAFKRVL